MSSRQEHDPALIRVLRLLNRLFERAPWALLLLGYIVLVPVGYVIGSGGISGDLASSPEAGGVSSAIAMALGWTIVGLSIMQRD